jgi:hypothetical protein
VNAAPSLLRNVVSVDVDVVSICIEGVVEHKGSVHERAWVHQGSSFLDLHSLEVEDEDSIEDLEGQSALSSEDHDFLVSDLVGVAHVGWDPLSFVDVARLNLLPGIFLDVINFDSIDNTLLVNSATE